MRGTVEAIFLAGAGGEPMRSVREVEAIAGQGLRGDRYARGLGFWSHHNPCQVTLIRAEDLEEIQRTWGLALLEGQHRRNLVVRGLDLEALRGRLFRVGEAVLAYQGPRPPCSYLESLTQPGMKEALAGRAGICARVVRSGLIRVGDPVEPYPPEAGGQEPAR